MGDLGAQARPPGRAVARRDLVVQRATPAGLGRVAGAELAQATHAEWAA
ncbi:MAG: hypothetical protein RJB61_2212 [Actinomycetota bacterium]|jgi:hypothetical protein